MLLEPLEDRTLPSMVNWIGGSGNWDNGSNWNSGNVPGKDDIAVINTASAATITIQASDNIQVLAVTTGGEDTLTIAGGSLTLTSGTSSLAGPLSMAGGTLTANGTGVTVSATGTTSISGASLTAEGGATLSLPELTTYASGAGTFFEATGAGSVLALSALTSITQTDLTSLYAQNGGDLNLSGLRSLSTPDINTVIFDTGGGTLQDGNLATINGYNVMLDGSDAHVADAWTSLTNVNLSVNGGSYSLGGITDVNGSDIYASNGGKLALPGLQGTVPNLSFQAAGTGSEIDAPALTAVSVGIISAQSGAKIDVSALTSLGTSGSLDSELVDTAHSTVLDGDLTTFENTSVEIDGPVSEVGNGWTNLTDGSSIDVTAGACTLPQVTDLDNSQLEVGGGGSLTLPKLSSYTNASNTDFLVTDSGSTLRLPALASLSDSSDLSIEAQNGGQIDLAALTSITGGDQGTQFEAMSGGTLSLSALEQLAGNSVTLTSDGTGSVLSVPSLTSIGSANVPGITTLQVTNSGTFDAAALASLSNVALDLDGTGTFSAGKLTTLAGTVSVSGGALTLSGLTAVNAATPITASDAATVSLPAGTTFTGTTILEATGEGSALTLPNTSLAEDTSAGSVLLIEALAGGSVTLSAVTTISGGPARLPKAAGTNSAINLPALQTFTSSGGAITSNGGSIKSNVTLPATPDIWIAPGKRRLE